MSFLEINHISKSFDDNLILDDINLNIEKGKFLSLVGPSGCGKTTLLRIIAGLETPDSGKINLNGNDITSLPPQKRKLGIVFQNYALFPNMNVYDNIAYGLRVKKTDEKEIEKKIYEILDKIKLSPKIRSKVSSLSGGEQQRISLARVLVNEPDLILFDEPLSNLDHFIRIETRNEIKRLQSELNITSVYVTHDQSEALSISDEIAVMNKGEIMQVGTPSEVYYKPSNIFTADFIGHYNIFNKQETSELFNKNIESSLSVLPENLKITQSPEGKLKLLSVSFTGFTSEIMLRFKNKEIRVTNISENIINASPGDTVGIVIKDEKYLML
ncbi:ATP-binding cassette domain-containing protein [soil metagenome]